MKRLVALGQVAVALGGLEARHMQRTEWSLALPTLRSSKAQRDPRPPWCSATRDEHGLASVAANPRLSMMADQVVEAGYRDR